MQLPNYWLPRPPLHLDEATRRAFDALLDAARASGPNARIHYDLPVPKWHFLCHLADHHRLALHGSGSASIERFETRQPNDLSEFGNQNAVYAAADGIWPMYYAILNRARYRMSLNNGCVSVVDPAGGRSGPFYLFSISRSALIQQPWHTGYVYLLPPESFVEQPPVTLDGYQVRVPHLASLVPVTPLARLEVAPHDFPFLDKIRGHDDARLEEYATAMLTGGPWPDD